MSNFLIVYDRASNTLQRIDEFGDDEVGRRQALRSRLAAERERTSDSVEVVVLEAVSEQALRSTHSRYFEDPATLARAGKSAAAFELYRDAKGEYRWRLKARNGQVLATGGQGYATKRDAAQSIEQMQRETTGAGLVDCA
jgi:uncharacterized protein YegP (UPF0339 family)